jgi:hypothetical protein
LSEPITQRNDTSISIPVSIFECLPPASTLPLGRNPSPFRVYWCDSKILARTKMAENHANNRIPAKAQLVTFHLIDEITSEIILRNENRLERFEALQVSKERL